MSTEDEVDVRMTQRKLSPTEMTMNMDLFDIIKHGFLPVCDLPSKNILTQQQLERLEPWLDNPFDCEITGWDADFEFELLNMDDVFVVSWHLHQPNSDWYGDEETELPTTTQLHFLCQTSAVGFNDFHLGECFEVQSWQQIQDIQQQHWHRFVRDSLACFEIRFDHYIRNQGSQHSVRQHQQLLAHWRRYKSYYSRQCRALLPVCIEHPEF